MARGEARSLQRNAADPEQVRYAARKEKERATAFGTSLAAVLRTPAGRFVLWELLARAGVYKSIWDPSARIHYNAGRQDFGHELLAEMLNADEASYLLMEREMRAYAKGEAREAAAVQQTAEERTDVG